MNYPYPPEDSELNPHDRLPCDIIPDGGYLPFYYCIAPCILDPDQVVRLECDCYKTVGVTEFQMVKQCEWKIVGDLCPAIPTSLEYNWECDPRIENCYDQYGVGTELNETNLNNLQSSELDNDWLWNNFGIPSIEMSETPDGKLQFVADQGGVKNIFNISPIMTNFLGLANNPNPTYEMQLTSESEVDTEDESLALIIYTGKPWVCDLF